MHEKAGRPNVQEFFQSVNDVVASRPVLAEAVAA
jgi:hypothetical protein